MATFAYRARDGGGQVVRGHLEAADERAAVQALRARGLVVTDIEPARAAPWRARPRPAPAAGPAPVAAGADAAPGEIEIDLGALARRLGRLGRSGRVGSRELAVFCRQFSGILEAGVPILRGFALVTSEMRHPALKEALTAVAADVETGRSLTEALAARSDAFPPLLCHLVAAGEQGGFLEETFRRLADHFEKEEHIAQKIRSATLYPKVVAVAAVLIVVVLVTLVVPTFTGVFEGMGLELPWITRALLALSSGLRRFWFLAPLPFLALYLGLRAVRAAPRGRYHLDRLALRLPVFGPLAAKRAMAVFARTLGTLLQGGVPVLQSLALVESTVGNAALEEVVRRASEEVRAGGSMVTALRASPVVPRVLVEMLSVGEEAGRLEEMLFRVAALYEADVERTAERLTSLIEPFIIVFLGGVVALILLSIFIPLFDVYQGLQNQ